MHIFFGKSYRNLNARLTETDIQTCETIVDEEFQGSREMVTGVARASVHRRDPGEYIKKITNQIYQIVDYPQERDVT